MNGHRLERFRGPATMVAALLLGQAAIGVGHAQSPMPRGLVHSPLAMPPAPAEESPTPTPLPSSVSPAIARLAGRPVPEPIALAPAVVEASVPQRAGPWGRPLAEPATTQTPPWLDGTGRPPSTEAAESLAKIGLLLKPVTALPGERRLPIDLAAALRLSDARPLVVAAAQASVWSAEAELTRAKVLWVPTFLFGFAYVRHDGGGPDFNKGIMTAPSVNYFMGGGGATLFVNLTDAIYEPLVARRVLDAKHWDVQAAKNDAVLATSDCYFGVHRARGTYAGSLYAVERGRDLVDRIERLTGELIPPVEADRARSMLAELEQRAAESRQDWRERSADLTQILRLDPRSVVEPLEHDHAQITLIDPARDLDDLMPIALRNRPEIASRMARVEAADARIVREKRRPLLPILMLNGFQHPSMLLQAGIFGLGPNTSLDQWSGRSDVSVQAIWQLENFGAGNLARIKAERASQSRSMVDFYKAQDHVVAEVTQAHAAVQSSAARVLQADRSLRTAIITFNGHLEGIGQTHRFGNTLIVTFRPQEAVYALEQVNVSFREYFATVAQYNQAQFALFHACGYPAQEIAVLRQAGAGLPIDLARPNYLPPVGNGPPPATR